MQQIVCLPADATRERDELKLQIALARTLLEQRGYADRQVGDAYAKARELSGHVDDPGMHLAILYGLWAHHYVRGKPAAMLEQAEEFLTVAEGQDEGGLILVGHRLVGTSHLIMGYMSRAIASLDQALMRYDPGKHGANSRTGQNLRARFGQDVGIGIYAYRSWALALAGRPAEAEQSADTALAQSGGLDRDDQSRFYALWHAGMAYVLLRDAERVAAIDSELMELANNRGLPYWQALAHFLRGWRVARTGHAMTAVELFHGGLELWAKTGSRIFRPICLAFLADAHAAADQRDLANQRFREALRIAAGTGERWAEPEIHRLYGNLLLRCSNPGAAISRYKRAIDLAREQGSRWFELRTGTSLARLLSERGQRIEANDVLVNIYQTFDARCTRPDITDARLLIEAIQ